MAESNEEWELSKENIRPIQQGRKQRVLKAALAPHPEEIINQQRQSFENELRIYSGNDPLSVWCNYIKWVEQNYPKGGREGHIKQLVERCFSILKDEQKYFNDNRFIDIMLKYASLCEKPLDVYNYMYSNNIGCKSAIFFINWSWELEQYNNMKKADEVLIEGINRRVEPFEKIKAYHADFQIRLAVKIKENLETNNFESENSRSAFAMLKPQKKNLAPVMRTGEAVIENKKSLILGRQQPQPKNTMPPTKVPFKIYNSENIDPSLPVQTHSAARNSLNSQNYKENEQKPSKWNKVKVKSHGQNFKILNEANPDFKLHCDEKNDEIYTPRRIPKTSTILRSHHRSPSPPMALFEPPDPTKIPMYPKNKVYGGAEEFSLEEIRAAEWFEQKKKTEQAKLLEEQQKRIEEHTKNEKMLKKQVEYLAKQVELLQSQFAGSSVKPCAFNKMLSNNQHGESITQTENKIISQKVHDNSNAESSRSNLQNNYCLTNKNKDTINCNGTDEMVQELYNRTLSHPTDDENKKLDLNAEFNEKCLISSSKCLPELSEPHQNDQTRSISQKSGGKLPFTFYHDPTTKIIPEFHDISSKGFTGVNEHIISKDSSKIPFSFYHDPTGTISEPNNGIFSETSTIKEDVLPDLSIQKQFDKLQNISKEPNKLSYTFYTDPSEITSKSDVSEAHQISQADNIFKKCNDELPFTLYQDPTSVIPNSVENVSVKMPDNKEHPSVLPHEESSEDVENIPPKGYVQETAKRELAGILQPSRNILFLPLEEQELDDDDNDSEFEDDYIYQKKIHSAEDTFFPPCNTEQFSAARFLASTPCVTRSSKSPNADQVPSSINSPQNTCVPVENTNSVKKDIVDDERVASKIEEKSFKEPTVTSELKTTCHSRLPNMLSVIMETSSENYSKSSSSASSSSSLTKSVSLNKQQSKLEPSSVSDVSSHNSDINFHSASVMHKAGNEENGKNFQLFHVDFDPFDQKITQKLLKRVNLDDNKNIYASNKSVRNVKVGENIYIGNETYIIDSFIAEGAFAQVFKATKPFEMHGGYSNKALALKVCRKSNEWEFYICSEIQKRLSEKKFLPDIRNSVMSLISAIKYPDGIVLVTEYGNLGTLLDVINFYKKQNSPIPELLVMFFTLEILHIISKLHECNIIHGDIKPDNFLLKSDDFVDIFEDLSKSTTCLQLIDFGRAIDLNLFDKGICFTTSFKANHFKCTEMKENRAWTFQLDWFGVLNCIHTMLFSDYMTVKKKNNGVWEIEKRFKRYWFQSLWEPLFNKLLNIPKCYEEPDVAFFINMIESRLKQSGSNFISQLTRFSVAYSERK